MWNLRENVDRIEHQEGPFAVAIHREKTSHQTLKWAIEHCIRRGTTVKLVYVVKTPSLVPTDNSSNGDGSVQDDDVRSPDNLQLDDRISKLFLPLRCFCMRRSIHTEIVLLEDHDVAKALIEYVAQNCIGTLLLGPTSKKRLSRVFKGEGIPKNVMRWAPDFCNVLVISKGRLSSSRSATRAPPFAVSASSNSDSASTPDILIHQRPPSVMEEEDAVIEEEFDEHDISGTSSGRESTESTFLTFYSNLESTATSMSKAGMHPQHHHQTSKYDSVFPNALPRHLERPPKAPTTITRDEVEQEVESLKKKLMQTTDKYNTACKELVVAKQQAKELEMWKKKAEERLQKIMVETENAASLLPDRDVPSRIGDEMMKAVLKSRKGKMALEALGLSHTIAKYESFIQILVVLFCFYLLGKVC